MSKIKSKNTKPEIIARKILTELGYRYRLHSKSLPGKPDIYFKKHKTAIFINGCFWHQHKKCKRSSIPKSNRDYWLPKLKKNIERFSIQKKELKNLEWKFIELWECQLKKPEKIKKNLSKKLLF